MTYLLPDTTWDQLSYVNPELIVANSSNSLDSAIRLREGLLRLGIGTQRVRRRYLVSTFELAKSIKNKPHEINNLRRYIDEKTTLKVPPSEQFSDRYLDWLIKLLFVTSGFATANTATRYFNALDHYLSSDATVERVSFLLTRFGPEKMYKSSIERRRFLDAQSALEDAIKSPFRELDHDPSETADDGAADEGDGDRADAQSHLRQQSVRDDDFDLPPADPDDATLVDDSASEHNDDEDAKIEYFDVDEAAKITTESGELAMKLRTLLHKSSNTERRHMRHLAFQLTAKLTQLRSLMTLEPRQGS